MAAPRSLYEKGVHKVEFYQVTRTTEKSVFIRRLADEPVPGSGGGTAMSDHCVPLPNTFRAEGWTDHCSELRKDSTGSPAA
jgi:hypothetical protein